MSEVSVELTEAWKILMNQSPAPKSDVKPFDFAAALASAEADGVARGMEIAIRVANENAWKHCGEDGYSRGLDKGAYSQLLAIVDALRAEAARLRAGERTET